MTLTILGIFCLICLNSFFALAEIAIIASRKAKLKELIKKGSIGAKKAEKLAAKPEIFLSTVQVGITIINVLLGIYSENEIQTTVERFFNKIGFLQEQSIFISYFLVVTIITYFTVLGEIVGKRISMLHPESIAVSVSCTMYYIFVKLLYPFVYLLTLSTKFCLKILKVKESNNHMSIDELKLMIRQAGDSGSLQKAEHDMMSKMVHISNTQVGAIMTPRNKLICINLQDSIDINLEKLKKYPFNYFPVIDGALSNLVGIASVKKLFSINITNESIALCAQEFPIIYIPEVAQLSRLIDMFKEKQSRIAIVLDEYGEIEGIATLNDILKIFIGELAIINEGEKSNRISSNKKDSFIVDGNVLIQEIKELLKISALSENDSEHRTLASFILKQCNGIPNPGDSFNSAGWTFKVLKLDKFRIARVAITKT